MEKVKYKINIDTLARMLGKNGFVRVEAELDHYLMKEVNGNRAILIINDRNMNVRGGSDALFAARKHAKRYGVEKDNVYVIVVGRPGGLKRYLNRKVIFFNYESQRFALKVLDNEICDVVKALRKQAKLNLIDAEEKWQAKPEFSEHSVLPLYILIALTVALYFVTRNSYERWGVGPSTLYSAQSYRFVTSLFTHSGIRHLTGNMIALLIFGKIYNKAEGSLSLYSVYFCGGILGEIINCLLIIAKHGNMNSLAVGASGAIFAVCGALVTETFMHPDFERHQFKIWFLIVVNLVVSSVGEGVSAGSHIYGFIAGILIGYIVKVFSLYERHERIRKLNEKKNRIVNDACCY